MLRTDKLRRTAGHARAAAPQSAVLARSAATGPSGAPDLRPGH